MCVGGEGIGLGCECFVNVNRFFHERIITEKEEKEKKREEMRVTSERERGVENK